MKHLRRPPSVPQDGSDGSSDVCAGAKIRGYLYPIAHLRAWEGTTLERLSAGLEAGQVGEVRAFIDALSSGLPRDWCGPATGKAEGHQAGLNPRVGRCPKG